MSYHESDVAETLDRLYPAVIGGPGWDDVLERLDSQDAALMAAEPASPVIGVLNRRSLGRRGSAGRPVRSLLAAALVGAAVAATPALAFSSAVRHFVGLSTPTRSAPSGWTRPHLAATVTSLSFPKQEPFGLPMVTVRFTVGEVGKRPGTGVTFGSYFLVHLASSTGAAAAPYFVHAHGSYGHYEVNVPRPRGGIGSVEIAGWINVRKGLSAANGTFWIPVIVSVQQY